LKALVENLTIVGKMMSVVEKHFRNTEELLRAISSEDIATWLLNKGYFPERDVLPPSFHVSTFLLKKKVYNNRDFSDLARRKLINISYPKTALTSRIYGIQHPWNYHDIVYYLKKEWGSVLNHLFHRDIKIYSYSLPIPVNGKQKGSLSTLRSGRMIYEWIEMAERDLVIESSNYQYIAKTDIKNFYPSIYTHSIGWALHGREEAFKDKEYALLGNKIDKLVQYSNDARTNGISIGSALSDLIAETILAGIDREISNDLSEVDFIAVRFKDDYRILCQSENDAEKILRVISSKLSENNLTLNESKTSILRLPDGLYRKHDREYFPHSLREQKEISFKIFEHTLLIALDIHRRNPGTSILEKFVSELFDENKKLKVVFSRAKKEKQVKEMISLLFLTKRESEKVLCHVLSITEQLYLEDRGLKEYLKGIVEGEIKRASTKGSTFEVVWLIFFSRYVGLGIKNFDQLIGSNSIKENEFCKSILNSRQEIFKDSIQSDDIVLFRKPSDCKDKRLVQHLAIFDR
jgi:hypothetical protein